MESLTIDEILDDVSVMLTNNDIGIEIIETGREDHTLHLLIENGQAFWLKIGELHENSEGSDI